jgi:hypothetical protein
MAPNKKRKSEAEQNEVSTDEEKSAASNGKKKARLVAPLSNGSASSSVTKLKYDLVWEEYGESTSDDTKLKPLFYLHSKTMGGCSKIAGFDIDMTIIKTKSGKTFATSKYLKSSLYLCDFNCLNKINLHFFSVHI